MPTQEEGEELLAAVEWWQSNEELHPMTCDYHSDVPLVPFLTPSRWAVYLSCPLMNCKHSQAWVPDVVLEAYRNRKRP